jgi:choice-of-anchor A domain-containing protein
MKARTPVAVVSFILLAALAAPLNAQNVNLDVDEFAQLVRNYNLVTFGNANLGMINNDTEGPMAIGGNLSLNGATLVQFSQFAPSSDPTLYVNGSLSIANGMTAKLNNGYASIPNMAASGWNSTLKNYTTPTGGVLNTTNAIGGNANSANNPVTNPTPASWSFSSIQSTAVAASADLASSAQTSTASIGVSNNNLVFNAGTSTGVVVFNLNAANFNSSGNAYNGTSFSGVTFESNGVANTIASNTEFVVNVTNASGKTIFGTGNGVNFNPPLGAGASQLLWNIVNNGSSDITTTLGNGGQFYGSVLAPKVALSNASNAPLSGQILTDSITYSNAQLNYTGFVAIPEPPSWACCLGAAALGAAFLRNRKLLLRS